MILKKLTATFGKLQQEQLELHEGLNVITAPNEAGKSTWAAFLLAMLYGIDTSERTTKTNLPAKSKYKPWSGQPMEGSIELRWQGDPITIERTGQGRTPMGQFRAYHTATGAEIPDLQAETCGQTLLGVERSVYERSGFIRQQGMTLTGDHALEARLSALVTTGDETVSYSRVEQRLRDLRNRRRHNKTGLLPQAEAELAQVQAQLDDMALLGRDILSLQARKDALEGEESQLQQILVALKAQSVAQQQKQLSQARQDWEKKEHFLKEKQQTVEGLPPLEDLQALLHQIDVLTQTGNLLESDLRLGVVQPEAPACPPVFEGLSADQVREKAEADAAEAERLGKAPFYAPRAVWIILAIGVMALAIGIGGVILRSLPMLGSGFALALFSLVMAAVRRSRNLQAIAQRAAILKPYRAADAADIRQAAADYREVLLLHRQQCATAQAQQQALDDRSSAFAAQRAELLAQVQTFVPDCADLSAARSAVQQAVYRQQFYTATLREARQAQAQYEAVRAAVGTLPEDLPTQTALPEGNYDPQQVSARLSAVRLELQDVRSRLDLRRGRLEASGDPVEAAARKEQLSERIARLQKEYDALTLAMDALAAANHTLQTRFSPQLNQVASRMMARMTDDRYDRVLLGQDLSVTAREAGAVVTHPTLALSAGTADQLYLAVRLAICQLALPEDAPLILDDALINFDDARMAAAMELLQELAGQRQILLFTCQGREQRWLDAHRKEATTQ